MASVNWLLKADSLIAAFETLIADDERRAEQNQPRRIQSVAYMLAGFAFENLLKGILISGESPLDERGRFILKSHNLLELSVEAGYTFNDEDRRLLERAQEFAIWAGRYPIPLNSESIPRVFHAQGEDWATIRLLFAKLRDDLQRLR